MVLCNFINFPLICFSRKKIDTQKITAEKLVTVIESPYTFAQTKAIIRNFYWHFTGFIALLLAIIAIHSITILWSTGNPNTLKIIRFSKIQKLEIAKLWSFKCIFMYLIWGYNRCTGKINFPIHSSVQLVTETTQTAFSIDLQ